MGGARENERIELKREDKGERRRRRNDVEDRKLETWTEAIRGSAGMRRAQGRRERSCDERLRLLGSELRERQVLDVRGSFPSLARHHSLHRPSTVQRQE
jgi:hypothetical protein